MAEGLLVVDREGELVMMNAAAGKLLRCREGQLLRRSLHDAVHGHESAHHSAEECPMSGVPTAPTAGTSRDDAFITSDGSLVPVAYNSSPLMVDGAHAGSVIAFRENSERRAVDAAQRETARELDVLRESVVEGKSALRKALSGLTVANAELVRRLSMAVEFRDEDTGAHIERIGRLSGALAEGAGLDADFCEQIRLAAPLHDIGKVAVPDSVLLKPGKLDPDDRAIIERHAEQGHRLLRGSASLLLDLAASIAWTHHERWDGTGYPRGLAGEEIPVAGRLVAIADVFDALTSDRVYRKAFPRAKALEILREGRGTHFDPRLLDVFFALLKSRESAPENAHEPSGTNVSSDAYLSALRGGDAQGAETVALRFLADGMPIGALHAQVITPAMRAIGELWEGGEMTVAGEHLATGITQQVLASVYQRSAGVPAVAVREHRVLLACVAGDHHTLGLQMIADQLEAASHSVINAGGDVSVEMLIEEVHRSRPDVVGLAATLPWAAQAAVEAVQALNSEFPALPIMLGGSSAPRSLEAPGVMVIGGTDEILPALEELTGERAFAAVP